MALRAMCKYYVLLTPSPSGGNPTDPVNSFSIEFGSSIVTGIPHMDIMVIVWGQCGLHFCRTLLNIARGWGDS